MKRVIISVVVLILLFGVYSYVKNQKESSRAEIRQENFLGIGEDEITDFRLIRLKDTINFTLEDGLWKVIYGGTTRLSDTNVVNQIVDRITDLDAGAVISSNPENRETYGVDSSSATRLTFYHNDRELADLYIGEDSPNYGSVYFRQVGRDEVRIGEGLAAYIFNKPMIGWLNKAILKADTTLLTAMEFEYPQEQFTLVRIDTTWFARGDSINGQVVANSDSIRLYLRYLSNFLTDDYLLPEDSAHYDPESIDLRMILRYENGELDSIRVHGKADNKARHYITTDDSDDVYVLYKARYDRLAKRGKNFVGL